MTESTQMTEEQKSSVSKNPLKSCIKILKKDKNLFYLTFLETTLVVMVSALFVLLNGKNINFRDILAQGGNVEAIISNNYQNLLAIILYIVIVYFINAYFNSLVSWTAYKVVKEEKTDVESSTSRVNKVFGAIAVFTSINIILKIISVFIKRSSGKVGGLSIGEMLFAGIFSVIGVLVWSLASFFVIPVIVIEGVSFQEALKKSTSIFKSTWGENLVSNISIAFLMLPGVIFFIILWLAGSHYFPNEMLGNIIIGVGVCGLLITVVLGSTLKAILKVVLYIYATTGIVYKGFVKDDLYGAFKNKKSSEVKV